MAGPGSPSYALAQWAGGPIPDALREKLTGGGILTMASAAALTLGVVTIPVYEIYKVGEDPRWLPGLDLLGVATGLRAAVVPHYDNAEGGNHDTRFCYMGERRLRMLEAQLPDDVFVLGVDSHRARARPRPWVCGGPGPASVVRVDGRAPSSPAAGGHRHPADVAREMAAGLPVERCGARRGRQDAQDLGAGAGALSRKATTANLEGAFIVALDTAMAGRRRGAPDLDSAMGPDRAGEDS
jgi:hypothetical protein